MPVQMPHNSHALLASTHRIISITVLVLGLLLGLCPMGHLFAEATSAPFALPQDEQNPLAEDRIRVAIMDYLLKTKEFPLPKGIREHHFSDTSERITDVKLARLPQFLPLTGGPARVEGGITFIPLSVTLFQTRLELRSQKKSRFISLPDMAYSFTVESEPVKDLRIVNFKPLERQPISRYFVQDLERVTDKGYLYTIDGERVKGGFDASGTCFLDSDTPLTYEIVGADDLFETELSIRVSDTKRLRGKYYHNAGLIAINQRMLYLSKRSAQSALQSKISMQRQNAEIEKAIEEKRKKEEHQRKMSLQENFPIASREKMGQITLAAMAYRNDSDDLWPTNMALLITSMGGEITEKHFSSPAAPNRKNAYLYVRPASNSNQAQPILIEDPSLWDNKGTNVALCNGQVIWLENSSAISIWTEATRLAASPAAAPRGEGVGWPDWKAVHSQLLKAKSEHTTENK